MNCPISARNQKKEHVNIIFIGHVDSGKSTITGQILQQTGMLDDRVVKKYQNSSCKTNFLQQAVDIFKDSANCKNKK
jgi:translation elongation factor EF-1alpha